MLSEAEVEEIRQGLRSGLRGPVLLKWCERLLAEREELMHRLRDTDDARREPRHPGDESR
jgi:hypothetical protein